MGSLRLTNQPPRFIFYLTPRRKASRKTRASIKVVFLPRTPPTVQKLQLSDLTLSQDMRIDYARTVFNFIMTKMFRLDTPWRRVRYNSIDQEES